MIKVLRFILYAFALFMAGACEVKEDVYFVGARPSESEILRVDKPRLEFNPQGEELDIQISSISEWKAVIDDNTGKFSISSASSGKGNGVVSISANPNTSSGTYEATLQIRSVNFEIGTIQVPLSQKNVILTVLTPPSVAIKPEEGDTVKLTISTSIDWKLEPVNTGGVSIDIKEYFDESSDLSGEGDKSGVPQEITLKWKPNYKQEPRSVNLRLMPASSIEFNDLQYFTLTQAAGTLPTVNCSVEVDIVDATISWNYTSRSPVKECGVMLYKKNGSSEELDSIIQIPSAGGFEKEHHYTHECKDLDEKTIYKVVPFVVNEVGRSELSEEFTTGERPESRRYAGVAIYGDVDVVTDDTSADITVNVTSDVEPLGDNRIASAVMILDDNKTVNGNLKTFELLSNGSIRYQYVFSTSSVGRLIPNKEYEYAITIMGVELPEKEGMVIKNEVSVSGNFKTIGQKPNFGDNETPEVGN